MDTETLRGALERAGLTSYQAEAYLTLLDLGTAPAIEVGRKCSVPVSQIYGVLRDLEDRGYAETMEQDKLYARPADPSAIRGELESQRDLLDDASAAVEERYERPAVMDHRISLIRQADTVLKHAEAFFEEAETEIEVAATSAQLRRLLPALREAHERGVVVRAAAYSGPDDPSVDELDVAGAVSALRDNLIPTPLLVIVDRHRVCFAPNMRSDESYGIVIRDRILPVMFHGHFLSSLWNLHPRVYVADDHYGTYVTIEEFVRDVYPYWADDYDIEVVVEGDDTRTDEHRVVTGRVTDVFYQHGTDRGGSPRLSDLGSVVNVTLDADDGARVVGGWGAVAEDLEMHRLAVVGIRPPRP